MGERKVLNKYYPPDFDAIKLPKLPGGRPDQYVVRVMAPFTMRCLTCGNYVYKGKKFNARKEDAKGENYLGIQIYRFYIRCPECLSEITFKTDPQNSDYAAEHGAMRTFQAERLAELEEQREAEEKEEEEASNPMLALENRTAESRMEMDVLDALEEIRDWNARNASVKHEQLLEGLLTAEEVETEQGEAVLAGLARRVFAEKRESIRRLQGDTTQEAPPTKQPRIEGKPTKKVQHSPNSQKEKLSGLVLKKSDRRGSSHGNGGTDKKTKNINEERHRGSAVVGGISDGGSAVVGGSSDGGPAGVGGSSSDRGPAGVGGSSDRGPAGVGGSSDRGPAGVGGSSETLSKAGTRERVGGLGLLCGYSDSSGDSD